MWRSLIVLLLCFVLKAQFVLGAEAQALGKGNLVSETTTESAFITPEKEIKVAVVKTESYATMDAASVLGTKSSQETTSYSVSLYPLLGLSLHTQGWQNTVTNSYTAGLGLELPLTPAFAVSLEGSYGDYEMYYRITSASPPFRHAFGLFTTSAIGKVYFFEGPFRPYLGAGMDALYFDAHAVSLGLVPYARWIGSATALVGAEYEVARNIAVGARASFTHPFINTPTANQPIAGTPEGRMMSVSYLKFLGHVSVGL